MRIVVHCNAAQQTELQKGALQNSLDVIWVFEKEALLKYAAADAILDLAFENSPEHLGLLRQVHGIKIINSVVPTLSQTDRSFIRINAWPTFLTSGIIEASCLHEHLKNLGETIFALFSKTVEWLPDEPGFVVPRIVSAIINEAHFALADGVSTPGEIDTAMTLGTAYPFGPFQWGEKIGLQNVAALLTVLSQTQKRYAPAPLLAQQAGFI